MQSELKDMIARLVGAELDAALSCTNGGAPSDKVWRQLQQELEEARNAIAAALSDKQAGEVNDVAVNAAARLHDHWTGDGTVGAMNAIRNTQEIVHSYLGASRSALVDVPAVEPVSKTADVIADLEEVRKAVFGDVGDEPDAYADYDRLSELSAKMRRAIAALSREGEDSAELERKFKLGDRVTKTKGSSWQGRVCGFYSTSLTPVGYCVESEREPGSVQIYPESALAATRSGSATTHSGGGTCD